MNERFIHVDEQRKREKEQRRERAQERNLFFFVVNMYTFVTRHSIFQRSRRMSFDQNRKTSNLSARARTVLFVLPTHIYLQRNSLSSSAVDEYLVIRTERHPISAQERARFCFCCQLVYVHNKTVFLPAQSTNVVSSVRKTSNLSARARMRDREGHERDTEKNKNITKHARMHCAKKQKPAQRGLFEVAWPFLAPSLGRQEISLLRFWRDRWPQQSKIMPGKILAL